MLALPMPLRLKLGVPVLGTQGVGIPKQPVTVTRNGDLTWTVTWPVGRSPDSIWLDGVEIGTSTTESYTFRHPNYTEDEAPPVEIVSAGATGDSERYPPRVRIRWRGNVSAVHYAVDQYVSSAWVRRCKVQETGLGEYEFLSQPQTDGAATEWRVKTLDVLGNAGTPIEFDFAIVRNPPPPTVTLSLSVTVSLRFTKSGWN